MATISKWYHRDSSSPNLGTLPSNSPATIAGGVLGTGTEAAGAATARDAIGTIGTSNPDIESSITAQAAATGQRLGHRRFVTRPIASQTLLATGNWVWSMAHSESNAAHNGTGGQPHNLSIYIWRPTTGLRVGTALVTILSTTLTGTTTVASSTSNTFSAQTTTNEGDVLVFDVYSTFTQSMAQAYTDQYAYDGTTEASTTTCASFVTPPVAITLSDNPWPKSAAINYQNPGVMMQAFGYAKRNWMWKPLKRPSLWTPELWRPEFWLPDHVAQGEIAV